jgi:hypothetical protein
MATDRAGHPSNVPGPFYVEDGCCTACGVPQHFAPDLFGADNDAHCFVRRQPATPTEDDSMLRALATQELGCIRYRGNDVTILRRLADAGEGSQCDVPIPADMVAVRRDHVSFSRVHSEQPLTAHGILVRLALYLAKQPTSYRTTAISDHDVGASLSVSWFEDRHHRIELLAAVPPSTRFLMRHFAPPRLSDTLHDWLVVDGLFCDVRWQSEIEWQAAGPWHHAPW